MHKNILKQSSYTSKGEAYFEVILKSLQEQIGDQVS